MASGTMPADEMPVMREPYDIMRNGLPGAKAAVTHLGKHPVQLIQDNVRAPSAIGAQGRTRSWISTRSVFTLKLTPRAPPLPLLTRVPPIPSKRSMPCWRTPTGSPCPPRWTSSARSSPSASPNPRGRWPRSRPPRPANDQKVCAGFPPAPSPRPLIPVSDLRPLASSLSLVAGRGDFPAFPRPGSASRS